MSDELRLKILLLLDEHSKTGSSSLMEDKEISVAMGQPVQEVQRQLDILESQSLVELHKTMGPIYSIKILPQGLLWVEQILESKKSQPKRHIGFDQDGIT